MTHPPFRFVDLFAGAGGFTEGFVSSGLYDCVLAVERDRDAAASYRFNHPGVPLLEMWVEDVADAPRADVLVGGPPCQGFSLAGRRIADDPRNALWREYVRIVGLVRPRAVLFENVAGLASMQGGAVLEAVEEGLASLGYHCAHALLNAADFGVPQARRRLIVAGTLDGEPSFPTSAGGAAVTVREALEGLPSIAQGEGEDEMRWAGVPSGYAGDRQGRCRSGTLYNHKATRHSARIVERYAMIPPGGTNLSVPEDLRTRKKNVYRLDPDVPAKTVTCNFRTDLLHPFEHRGLTVREAARLQSFDDDYRFFGALSRKARFLTQDDQVGNAVPPLLARALAVHLAGLLA